MNQIAEFFKKNGKLVEICASIFQLVCFLFPFYVISYWGYGFSASGFQMWFETGFFSFLFFLITFAAVALFLVTKFVNIPKIGDFLGTKMMKLALTGGSIVTIIIGMLIGTSGAGGIGGWGVGVFLFIIAGLVNVVSVYFED